MNLKCSVFVIFLITFVCEKTHLVETAKMCKWCDTIYSPLCISSPKVATCTPENDIAVRNVLEKYFTVLRATEPNSDQYNCFMLELEIPGNDKSVHRIENCIGADIGICNIMERGEQEIQTKTCLVCKDDLCTYKYGTNLSSSRYNNTKRLALADDTNEDYSDDPVRDNEAIETHSMIFFLIVFVVIILSIAAWILARLYFLQPPK